jgi:leader peptidase (prepilin peptidase) / N-methyltransferase
VSSEPLATTPPRDAWPPNLARNATFAIAAFLSVLAAIRYGIHAETAVQIVFISVLVAISRVDLERRIIPNRIVVPAWIAVLLAHLAIHPHHWLEWIVSSFGAGLFFLVVALVYPGGLGMGDVKLALLIGAALGWSVVAALLLGTLASGIVAAVLLVREGSTARKKAIPLGPFLAGGAIVVILFL